MRLTSALAGAAMALATACGGGDSGEAPVAEGRATPSAVLEVSPNAEEVTEAEASAAAKMINLTQNDVPDLTRSPAPPLDAQVEQLTAEFVSCLGGEKPIYDLPSDDFSSGSSGVSSSVAVFEDADAVRDDLAALARDTAPDCVGTYVHALQGTSGEISVERLSPTAPGTDGAYGFDVRTTGASGEPMSLQVLGFGTGRTEVSLFAYGDVPAEQRDALFATLVQRGLAHAP